MRVAVITLVAGRHEHLRLQIRGLASGSVRPEHYVVVTMDDPDVPSVVGQGVGDRNDVVPVRVRDGRLPLARARNAGAEHALAAGAELLVFLDVDCVPGPRTLDRYMRTARDGALLCGTVAYLPPPPAEGYSLDRLPRLAPPHQARPSPPDDEVWEGGDPNLFWSLSFAVTAGTWRHIGGFHEEYEGYGGEDTDFGRMADSAGVRLCWVGGAPAYHQHHETSRPPVGHLDDILTNGAVFHRRWGEWPMRGWLQEFADLGLAEYDPSIDCWRRPARAE
ncbi:glycosyltransferase family 2 protein [Streptodolium elevatio]